MNSATTKTVCPKCDGRKTLSWTRVAEGVCFTCNGAGVLEVTTEELAAVALPRATVIADIKVRLDRLAAAVDADDYEGWAQVGGWDFAKLLGHAEEDVYARALAAFRKLYPYANADVAVWNVERDARAERAILASKVRTVVKSVRKVA